jgi:hypothetical protein
MKPLLTSRALGLLCLAPCVFSRDPLSALSSTFQGQLIRQINQGVDQTLPAKP